MSISQIIEGTWKNILNLEEDLFKKRMEICLKCKLKTHSSLFGDVCNGELYLNPATNETSEIEKPGFKQGCGCILASKTRVKDAHCPAKKW